MIVKSGEKSILAAITPVNRQTQAERSPNFTQMGDGIHTVISYFSRGKWSRFCIYKTEIC